MAEMTGEAVRVAEQLRNAFTGEPWHGYPILTLTKNIPVELAAAKMVPGAHSIWEIVLHIDIYVRAAIDAIAGTPIPRMWGTEVDWPSPAQFQQELWRKDLLAAMRNAEALAVAVESMPDAKLAETVPGRTYDFYYLLHGIIQHSLYHAGQIALLTSAGKTVNPD